MKKPEDEQKSMKCFGHEKEENNVTKFTKYISDNYFWISYKTLFYVIADGLKLTMVYDYIKNKLKRPKDNGVANKTPKGSSE